MNNQQDRELGWDDEIVNDGPNNILLPEGDYNFTVASFKRGRHQGSTNLPPCNKAELEVTIHTQDHGDVTVHHNLFLHTKTEGFLSNFFTGIGQKQPGEPLRMNWGSVVGSKGRCQLEHNKYTDNNGNEQVNNQIKTFYSYEEYLKDQQSGNVGQFQQAPQQTQQPQQPTQNQAPFPTGEQQQPQSNTGFTKGQF